jgi:hypothetical protein
MVPVAVRPGSYIIRMAGGFVQIADGSNTTLTLISGTLADGTTAFLVVLAMGVGLLAPKLVSDRLQRKSGRLGAELDGSSLYA